MEGIDAYGEAWGWQQLRAYFPEEWVTREAPREDGAIVKVITWDEYHFILQHLLQAGFEMQQQQGSQSELHQHGEEHKESSHQQHHEAPLEEGKESEEEEEEEKKEKAESKDDEAALAAPDTNTEPAAQLGEKEETKERSKEEETKEPSGTQQQQPPAEENKEGSPTLTKDSSAVEEQTVNTADTTQSQEPKAESKIPRRTQQAKAAKPQAEEGRKEQKGARVEGNVVRVDPSEFEFGVSRRRRTRASGGADKPGLHPQPPNHPPPGTGRPYKFRHSALEVEVVDMGVQTEPMPPNHRQQRANRHQPQAAVPPSAAAAAAAADPSGPPAAFEEVREAAPAGERYIPPELNATQGGRLVVRVGQPSSHPVHPSDGHEPEAGAGRVPPSGILPPGALSNAVKRRLSQDNGIPQHYQTPQQPRVYQHYSPETATPARSEGRPGKGQHLQQPPGASPASLMSHGSPRLQIGGTVDDVLSAYRKGLACVFQFYAHSQSGGGGNKGTFDAIAKEGTCVNKAELMKCLTVSSFDAADTTRTHGCVSDAPSGLWTTGRPLASEK